MATYGKASPNKVGSPCRVPVICVDDSGRPNEVPLSRWPKKGAKYTITSFVVMESMQGKPLGVTLDELSLDGCYPYKVYVANRFREVVPAVLEESAKEVVEEDLELA